MTQGISILKEMNPITLDEMQNIRLMDRIDFKFVVSASVLPQLLEEIAPFFRVQTIDNEPIASYATQYFDTPDLAMFRMHQNGKLNRQKIRIRSYVDSNLSFLEVKNKNNKGRTSKTRIPVSSPYLTSIQDLTEEKQFLEKNSIFDSNTLQPALTNDFRRITLVNNKGTERITIDINLSFSNYATGNTKSFQDLMILELKQDGWQYSDFRNILYHLHIKPSSFSKYCMGTILTNPNVKYNQFKNKLSKINKLINE